MSLQLTQPNRAFLIKASSQRDPEAFWYAATALIIFLAAVLMRVWHLSSAPGIVWDEPAYATVSHQLASTGHLMSRIDPYTHNYPFVYQPPFYFWLTVAWGSLVGHVNIASDRSMAVLASLIMLALLFAFLRRVLGRYPALVATSLVAVDGWMVYANRVGWIENTLLVLVVASVWTYWWALQEPSRRRFRLAGLMIGLTIIFKHTGTYVLVAVLVNWLIVRDHHDEHKALLVISAIVVVTYGATMAIAYQSGDMNPFLMEMSHQIDRVFGSASSARRGSIDDFNQLVSPLFAQYKLFASSVLVAAAGVSVVLIRLGQCAKRRSFAPVAGRALLFSWAVAGIVSFAAIKLRYPSYFELLLVPLYVYLAAEITDLLRTGYAHAYRILWGLVGLLLIGSLASFTLRIVEPHEDAMRQVAVYAREHLPARAGVLTEVSIANEIKQPWCDLQVPLGACHGEINYIITYRSDDNQLRDQFPITMSLLANSKLIKVFRGFEETIDVWRLNGAVDPETIVSLQDRAHQLIARGGIDL